MAKKTYTPSKQVSNARSNLSNINSKKPGAYQSAWKKQMNAAMKQILNREEFSYDVNQDMLYRQYKDQAIRGGQLAMMDTMGQAAAMTGGYGNSYAQSVGQQAYQQQLQSLNDRVPELYALALEQYDRKGQSLMDRYSLLSDRDQQDYSRYRDKVDNWEKAYQRSWDRYQFYRDFDYNQYRDSISDSQWAGQMRQQKRELAEKKREFNKRLYVLGK